MNVGSTFGSTFHCLSAKRPGLREKDEIRIIEMLTDLCVATISRVARRAAGWRRRAVECHEGALNDALFPGGSSIHATIVIHEAAVGGAQEIRIGIISDALTRQTKIMIKITTPRTYSTTGEGLLVTQAVAEWLDGHIINRGESRICDALVTPGCGCQAIGWSKIADVSDATCQRVANCCSCRARTKLQNGAFIRTIGGVIIEIGRTVSHHKATISRAISGRSNADAHQQQHDSDDCTRHSVKIYRRLE